MSRLNKRQRQRERQQRRAQRKAERQASAPEAAVSGFPSKPASPTGAEPIRGVAADVIDASLRWHVARTLPRMGTRALQALKDIKVTTYLPRASEVVVRRGRRVVRRFTGSIRGMRAVRHKAASLDPRAAAVRRDMLDKAWDGIGDDRGVWTA